MYIIWGILNLGLFIALLYGCFYAAKSIRNRYGSFAAIAFVILLLSFVGRANSSDDDTNPDGTPSRKFQFNSPDSLDKRSNEIATIQMEKNSISEYKLWILYGREKGSGNLVPVSADSDVIGYVGGTGWKASSIIVNPSADNKQLHYHVLGTVKWKLLWMTVYSESKSWEGFVPAK